jgi:hypothetical protein
MVANTVSIRGFIVSFLGVKRFNRPIPDQQSYAPKKVETWLTISAVYGASRAVELTEC